MLGLTWEDMEAIRENGDQSLKHVVNFNGEFLAVSREDVHTDKPGSSGGWILGGHLAEPKSSFLDLLNQASGLGGPGLCACEEFDHEDGRSLHDVV